MRMKRWRTTVAVVGGLVAALLVPPGPAGAAFSGAGWAAYWAYDSTTTMNLTMTTHLGSLTGRVVESAGRRTFSLTLTDTVASDGRCPRAQVASVLNGPAVLSFQACSTSQVTVGASLTGQQFFYLCDSYSSPPGTGLTCNRLQLPVLAAPLRVNGTSLGWRYLTDPGQEDDFIWWAQVLEIQAMGTGSIFDNPGGPEFGWSVKGILNTVRNPAPLCASGDLYQEGGPSAVVSTCAQARTPLVSQRSDTPRFRLNLCRLRPTTGLRQCLEGWIA